MAAPDQKGSIVAAPDFSLNPALDPAALTLSFREHGRVQVRDLLAGRGSGPPFQHLQARDDWRLVIDQSEKLFELGRKAQTALPEQARQELDLAVHKACARASSCDARRPGSQMIRSIVRTPVTC